MVKNTVVCAAREGREKEQKASLGKVVWYAAVTSRVHSHTAVCGQFGLLVSGMVKENLKREKNSHLQPASSEILNSFHMRMTLQLGKKLLR